ncbi:hypothetical protein MTO96_035362 [Rhipicephalus appendiculatus]
MEHSPVDGTVVIPILDYCYTYMKKTSKHKLEPPSCPDDKPIKLEFNLSKENLDDIATAKAKMEELARDVDVVDLRFPDYGKDFIKSCRMSPDSFIQMAFQLSFFRLHGHSPATYESASTRMFLLGRTEAIRSQCTESDKFCREYLSGKLNMAEKDAMLRNAIASHKEYASRVSMSSAAFDYYRDTVCCHHCSIQKERRTDALIENLSEGLMAHESVFPIVA